MIFRTIFISRSSLLRASIRHEHIGLLVAGVGAAGINRLLQPVVREHPQVADV